MDLRRRILRDFHHPSVGELPRFPRQRMVGEWMGLIAGKSLLLDGEQHTTNFHCGRPSELAGRRLLSVPIFLSFLENARHAGYVGALFY